MVVIFLVLRTISNQADLTQKKIIELTGLSERTVRNILRSLVKAGVVIELNNLADMRFKMYRLMEVKENEKRKLR